MADEDEARHPFFDDPDLQLARQGIDITTEIASSPTLRYLFEKAAEEARLARDEIVQVDPTNTAEIIRLQMVAMIDFKVQFWIKEAVDRGRQAEDRIRDEDEYPD